LSAADVLFIYSAVRTRGKGGLGVGVPQKLGDFLKLHNLKFKAR